MKATEAPHATRTEMPTDSKPESGKKCGRQAKG